jgi:hypothetical protein
MGSPDHSLQEERYIAKKTGKISAIVKCKEDTSKIEICFLVRESRRVAR